MNTRTASFLPRLVQFLLLLLAGALLARAADSPTVIYSTLRLNGAAFSNVVVQVTPIQLSTLSNSIVAPFAYSNVTRADGTLTITNIIPQSYRVTLRYATGITSFTNCFTGLTGTIYASDYICGATPTNGLIAYSTAQADALFALRTNAIRMQTNGVSVAAGYTNLNWSSGVTGYLSGATLVLGVNASGGGGDAGGTNARQWGTLTLTNLSGTGALTNSAQFVASGSGSASNLNVRSLNGVDSLALTVNTNSLVVTNGRVGIGTNAPGAALHTASGIQIDNGGIRFGLGANSCILSNTGAEQFSMYSQPGILSATLFTGNLRVFNNAGNSGRIGLRAGNSSAVNHLIGWTNGMQISDSGSGFGNGYVSNIVLVGATIWRSNTVTAAAVAAAITNGDFGQITISNGLYKFWMSNNVMNWKLSAP